MCWSCLWAEFSFNTELWGTLLDVTTKSNIKLKNTPAYVSSLYIYTCITFWGNLDEITIFTLKWEWKKKKKNLIWNNLMNYTKINETMDWYMCLIMWGVLVMLRHMHIKWVPQAQYQSPCNNWSHSVLVAYLLASSSLCFFYMALFIRCWQV